MLPLSAAGEEQDTDFLAFLEYLGSWEEGEDEAWLELLDEDTEENIEIDDRQQTVEESESDEDVEG